MSRRPWRLAMLSALLAGVVILALPLPAVAAAPADTDTSGTVNAVGSGSITITTRKGKAKTFRLRANTSYDAIDGGGSADAVVAGAIVKVDFATAPDGTVEATRIVVGRNTAAGWLFSTDLEGTVATLGAGTLAVQKDSGKVVTVGTGPGTKIRRIGTAVALHAGDHVLASLDIAAGGAVTARKVEVGVALPGGTIVFGDAHKGTVVAVSPSSVTLDLKGLPATAFPLGATTKFERLGNPATRAAVRPGSVVKARLVESGGRVTVAKLNVGLATATGNLYADHDAGRVVGVSGSGLVVQVSPDERRTYRLSRATEITQKGLPAARAVLKPGAVVRVVFAPAGGGLTARKVVLGVVRAGKEVFPKKVSGVIVSASGSRLVVRKAKGTRVVVALTRATVFRGPKGAVPRGSVKVGRAVQIVVDPVGASRRVALVVTSAR